MSSSLVSPMSVRLSNLVWYLFALPGLAGAVYFGFFA
jgi:hypothetical protein